MKQIRCEMCGNSDLIKQDGVFVCQFCGAKYTLEEAKKLLIELLDKNYEVGLKLLRES